MLLSKAGEIYWASFRLKDLVWGAFVKDRRMRCLRLSVILNPKSILHYQLRTYLMRHR